MTLPPRLRLIAVRSGGAPARPVPRILPAACVALALAIAPGGESHANSLHRCDGGGGKLVFSNVEVDNSCEKSLVNRRSGKNAASAGTSPSGEGRKKNYPSVSRTKQQERDLKRRQVLEQELRDEHAMFDELLRDLRDKYADHIDQHLAIILTQEDQGILEGRSLASVTTAEDQNALESEILKILVSTLTENERDALENHMLNAQALQKMIKKIQ